MDDVELAVRKAIAVQITDPYGLAGIPPEAGAVLAMLAADGSDPACAQPIPRGSSILPKSVPWSAGDKRPVETPIAPPPSETAALPQADWLVITWTRDEHRALARVFTPENPSGPHTEVDKWHPYRRNYESYTPDLRSYPPMDVHPAIFKNQLGSYWLCQVGQAKVVVFKSELHMNRDGPKALRDGRKLPLCRLIDQLVNEVHPKYLISTGTAGGTVEGHSLGDVVITTSGYFHCSDPKDFRRAPFNCKRFGQEYWVTERRADRVQALMLGVEEPPFGPPHPSYPRTEPIKLPRTKPQVHECPNLPILTTDYFEFGNTTNQLGRLGCAVEMDDALIAMTCEEMPPELRPKYAFVRNISDPVINGNLARMSQIMWAVFYYENFGLLTSYNSALTTWGIISGTE